MHLLQTEACKVIECLPQGSAGFENLIRKTKMWSVPPPPSETFRTSLRPTALTTGLKGESLQKEPFPIKEGPHPNSESLQKQRTVKKSLLTNPIMENPLPLPASPLNCFLTKALAMVLQCLMKNQKRYSSKISGIQKG